MTSPGLGMSKMTSTSGGLEWPRIFREVIQPRNFFEVASTLNFSSSHKIWAKSDYWNPSKSHIFCSKLVHFMEAVFGLKSAHSKLFSTDSENWDVNWFADHWQSCIWAWGLGFFAAWIWVWFRLWATIKCKQTAEILKLIFFCHLYERT